MDPFWAGLVALVPVGLALLYGWVLGVGLALLAPELLPLPGALLPGALLRGALLAFPAPTVVQLALKRPFYIERIF